jgi:protein lin-54
MENDCLSIMSVFKPLRVCNCKYSKCLKLYCECFSSGQYCIDCNCNCCYNKIEHEVKDIKGTRMTKIKTILDRDPLAFRPKVPMDQDAVVAKPAAHFKGCNCKKTKCKKKYCECFNAGILCSSMCKCNNW